MMAGTDGAAVKRIREEKEKGMTRGQSDLISIISTSIRK
jgi:hypothetical protein